MARLIAKEEASELWTAIIQWGLTYAELQGEGNSGEFHNEKAAEELAKEEEMVHLDLCQLFAHATGWRPFGRPDNGYVFRQKREALDA